MHVSTFWPCQLPVKTRCVNCQYCGLNPQPVLPYEGGSTHSATDTPVLPFSHFIRYINSIRENGNTSVSVTECVELPSCGNTGCGFKPLYWQLTHRVLTGSWRGQKAETCMYCINFSGTGRFPLQWRTQGRGGGSGGSNEPSPTNEKVHYSDSKLICTMLYNLNYRQNTTIINYVFARQNQKQTIMEYSQISF